MAAKIKQQGTSVWYRCPGCRTNHRIVTGMWAYNGDEERPTITPSVKVGGEGTCHHFVTDGQIHYLGDCDHELRGTTVKMEDFDSGGDRAQR